MTPIASKLEPPLFELTVLGHAGAVVVLDTASRAIRIMVFLLVQRHALLDRARPRVDAVIGPLSIRGLHESRAGDESAERSAVVSIFILRLRSDYRPLACTFT